MLTAGQEWDSHVSGQPFKVGHDWVVLADDYYVEDRFGVERVVGDTIKLPVNPILIADKPWEDSVSSPHVIFDGDQGLFHMWYKGSNRTGYTVQMQQHKDLQAGQAPPYFVGYARSSDGIHWEKPDLDLHPLVGFDRTNVVAIGDKRAQEHNVLLNPDRSDPQRRFIMTYKDVDPEGSSRLMLATSGDGVNWTIDRHLSPIATNLRDGGHQVVHDPERDRWLYYRRPPGLAQVSHLTVANIQRRYGVSVNDHLGPEGWSYPRMVLTPEEEADVPWIDHLTVLKWGTHFVGLWTGLDERVEGLAETHIAFSRDGIRWTRLPHRPVFIARGRPGDFDAGEVGAPRSAVTVGDKTYIYYTGNMAGQKANRGTYASVGVARMRSGRWAGVRADSPDGWLLTREMTVSGDRLELNHKELWVPYDDRAASDHLGSKNMFHRGKNGYVRVEIARRPSAGEGADGGKSLQPIEGFTLDDCDPVVGDAISTAVTWNGSPDVGALRGQAVFLRFHPVAAELYGMRFASD